MWKRRGEAAAYSRAIRKRSAGTSGELNRVISTIQALVTPLSSAPHIPWECKLFDETQFQSGAPMNRQSVPLKIDRHRSIYIDVRDCHKLLLENVVDPKAGALCDAGLAVKLQALGEPHRRHTYVNDDSVLGERVHANGFGEGAVSYEIAGVRQNPTTGKLKPAAHQLRDR
jgi:hypothetical protein